MQKEKEVKLTIEEAMTYIGKVLPYKNTAGKIANTSVDQIRITPGRNPYWFYGVDVKTNAKVYYPIHLSIELQNTTTK